MIGNTFTSIFLLKSKKVLMMSFFFTAMQSGHPLCSSTGSVSVDSSVGNIRRVWMVIKH